MPRHTTPTITLATATTLENHAPATGPILKKHQKIMKHMKNMIVEYKIQPFSFVKKRFCFACLKIVLVLLNAGGSFFFKFPAADILSRSSCHMCR